MTRVKTSRGTPELIVSPLSKIHEEQFNILIKKSGIKKFGPKVEVWTSDASNRALAYSTHGIFRYFGKFPPPIARYLIQTYTKPGDLVIDPMCGSGTTGLEAMLLGRRAKCFDINPLSVLISTTKVTPVNKAAAFKALDKLNKEIRSKKVIKIPDLAGLRDQDHWFLKETQRSLQKIRVAINELKADDSIKNIFNVALLSIVRRVSRATTQQGRLFLDAETAEKDAIPFFQKKVVEIIDSASALEGGDVEIAQRSILDQDEKLEKSPLIICHPPYFNSYKYSSVNSLELSWMNIDHAHVRKAEIREAFKVGKPEKVEEYVDDMQRGLRNIAKYLSKNGRLALMIGDTVIRGEYIPVTKMLLSRLQDVYCVERSVVRIPKFTEASWAASQRRKGKEVGINLCDLIVVLKKK